MRTQTDRQPAQARWLASGNAVATSACHSHWAGCGGHTAKCLDSLRGEEGSIAVGFHSAVLLCVHKRCYNEKASVVRWENRLCHWLFISSYLWTLSLWCDEICSYFFARHGSLNSKWCWIIITWPSWGYINSPCRKMPCMVLTEPESVTLESPNCPSV